MGRKTSAAISALFLSAAIVPASGFLTAAASAQEDEAEAKRRNNQTLGTTSGKVLQDVVNDLNAEPPNNQAAVNKLSGLLERDIPPFDRSTALEIRGGTYAALEQYGPALRDFAEVLRLDALPFDRLKQIRYNLAQLYYQEEQYQQAIQFMQEYLRDPANREDSNAWYILALSHVSLENFQQARQPAERALQYESPRKKETFNLLNFIYSELGLQAERGQLLEVMVERFPEDAILWQQLSGAYAQAGRDQDALAALKAAYEAGLLEGEDNIKALAGYYGNVDNPYQGAKLLEDEIAAGTVAPTVDNLVLLGQFYSQAREAQKSAQALTRAAEKSGTGELYYRIGQAYSAEADYDRAVPALNTALQRGGLGEEARGEIYLLLGGAYFSMDSDSDAGRDRARQAYQQASRYASSRPQAQGWVQYIDEIENTLRRQDEVERLQRSEARRREVERCETLIDLAELGGGVEPGDLENCERIIAQADEREEEAEAAAEAAAAGQAARQEAAADGQEEARETTEEATENAEET